MAPTPITATIGGGRRNIPDSSAPIRDSNTSGYSQFSEQRTSSHAQHRHFSSSEQNASSGRRQAYSPSPERARESSRGFRYSPSLERKQSSLKRSRRSPSPEQRTQSSSKRHRHSGLQDTTFVTGQAKLRKRTEPSLWTHDEDSNLLPIFSCFWFNRMAECIVQDCPNTHWIPQEVLDEHRDTFPRWVSQVENSNQIREEWEQERARANSQQKLRGNASQQPQGNQRQSNRGDPGISRMQSPRTRKWQR
ncbi:hypothetical protein HDK64DRAFT_258176 [Phyllosticta capitalensis]